MRRLLIVLLIAACGKSSERAPTPTPDPKPVALTEAGIVFDEDGPPDRWVTIKDQRDFKPLAKPAVVRFAIDTWAGWAPLVVENEGLKPGKVWKDAKGGEFQVEIVIADNPVDMLWKYAQGELHVAWGTADMLPMYVRRLGGEPKSLPRVVQQVSWSAGADGLLARDKIDSIAALRGKSIAVAENTPSHFFLLALLGAENIEAKDVKLDLTDSAVNAMHLFESEDRIDAAVGWLPEMDRIAKVKGNHMLATTADHPLIANLWFARADFAAAHPDIVRGLARGIAKASARLANDPTTAAGTVSEAFRVPMTDATDMLRNDAKLVGAADSARFLDGEFRALYAKAAALYMIDNAIEPAALVDATLR